MVDEDGDFRLLYADALARPGYHVDVAEDGAVGCEALQANFAEHLPKCAVGLHPIAKGRPKS